jgi:hypothetical protein
MGMCKWVYRINTKIEHNNALNHDLPPSQTALACEWLVHQHNFVVCTGKMQL